MNISGAPRPGPPAPGAPHLAEMCVRRRTAPHRILLCALLFALPAFALAAQSKPAPPAMPKNPLALLQLGALRNGLTAPGLPPWHIKVSYQTYKPNGHPQATGTFEEWWAAPDEYVLVFDRKGYHLQAWVTPHGSFAIGNPDLPMPERLVYHWIVAPIPRHPDLTGAHFRYRVRLIGPMQLPCVQVDSRQPAPGNLPPQYPTFCFESHHPMLRIADTRISEVVTTAAVGELGRQYLAQHFTAVIGPRIILTATLQRGESFIRIDPSFFAPPANARPAPPPSTSILYLTARESATHLIPSSAAHNGPLSFLQMSHAFVELAASIDTHGRVHGLQILGSTDPYLVSSIYQAVSHFRYRPFLLNGAPTAVRTRILLDFRVRFPK